MQIKTDRATYLPSPLPSPLPKAGESFIDGLSGVKLTRLTDERDGSGFGTTYSIWPTANRDNTRLWILNSATNTYYIADFDPVSGSRVGALRQVAPIGARHYANHESGLWSGVDSDKLFLFVDAVLHAYRPSTNKYEVVKDLTPILGTGYHFHQQHKSRDDKRFAGSGPLGFAVYDVELDRVLLDVRTTDMNGIALDKSGKWLLYVPDDDHTEYIYNVETGAREQITSDRSTGLPDFTVGHLDVGTDIIAGNDRWGGAITARKFSAPHAFTRPFVYAPTGWISHHVSMTADDGNWALLSTYLEIIGPRDANGKPIPPFDPNKFKDEVLQIGIQGDAVGKIRRLFHHHSQINETDFSKRYWQIPKANQSRDGRFVFFTMGGTRNDLWVADLGAGDSIPTPIPTPDPIPIPDPPKPDPIPTPDPISPVTGAPVVTLISPANGATLSGRVTVTASVTDADEAFLIVDDIVTARGVGTSVNFEIDTAGRLNDGTHSLYVRAWKGSTPGDSQKISVVVKNAVEPPIEPPPPVDPPPIEPPPIPTPTPSCSISAPVSITVPRNGIGQISVTLRDVKESTTITVQGSDGQVTVNPLSRTVASPGAIVAFQVRVKNKKQVRVITFSSSCGSASVKVNVT